MPLRVTHLGSALGAEVRGFDARACDDTEFAALRGVWHEAGGVLVLRDQHLEPEEHLTFSRRFGPLFGEAEDLQESVRRYLHPDHPGIYRVSNKVHEGVALGRARAGTYWHSDVSFRRRPAMASLLYALEIPACGGDTLFAGMSAAWETLSDGMQALLARLRAVHDFATIAPVSYSPDQIVGTDFDGQNRWVHPVVIRHPETGRRALFVNPGFTSHLEDCTRAESRPLLGYLQTHATRPEHVYRHRWSPRDLVIWDNRCVMHYAIADYTGGRHMHRTTVIAEEPVA
jgi:taurine dioxygenase